MIVTGWLKPVGVDTCLDLFGGAGALNSTGGAAVCSSCVFAESLDLHALTSFAFHQGVVDTKLYLPSSASSHSTRRPCRRPISLARIEYEENLDGAVTLGEATANTAGMKNILHSRGPPTLSSGGTFLPRPKSLTA